MLQLVVFFTAILQAQDGFSANYDATRSVKLQGPVTRIDWTNPHAYIFVDVRDSNGTVANWAVEIGNPLDLEKNGWKRTSLHIGDVVAVEGNVARGEARRTFAKSVSLARTNQKLFTPRTGRGTAAAKARTNSALARWTGKAWTARRPKRILGRLRVRTH
jgi:hypothetical protein